MLIEQIDDLEEKLHTLEIEIASRRSQEKVVVYLGYAAIAAGILIGAFGFSEISDVDDTVSVEISRFSSIIDQKIKNVDNRLDAADKRIEKSISDYESTLQQTIDNRIASFGVRNEAKLEEFAVVGEKMNVFLVSLDEAVQRWKEEIEPKLNGLEEVDPDEDLKGRYLEIVEQASLPEEQRPSDWRARATAIIKSATRQLSKAAEVPDFIPQFDPDDLFNLAQLARRLGRFDLNRNLTEAAYEADEGQAARALYLQSRALYLGGSDGEIAFAQLLEMVQNLSLDAPHIVTAEAWNVAESLRRYGELIDAINALIAKQETDPSAFVPSYVFAVRGNAHQRRGLPGDLDLAVDSYREAIIRLEAEGLLTQWADATIRDSIQYFEQLRESGTDMVRLDEAISNSKVGPIRRLAIVQNLLKPSLVDGEGTSPESLQLPSELLELLQGGFDVDDVDRLKE